MTAIPIAERILDAFRAGATASWRCSACSTPWRPMKWRPPQSNAVDAAPPHQPAVRGGARRHVRASADARHARTAPRAARTHTVVSRATPADNLIFDAVINALLCHMFPKPEHTSFFTDFYSDARFSRVPAAAPGGMASLIACAGPARSRRQRYAARAGRLPGALFRDGRQLPGTIQCPAARAPADGRRPPDRRHGAEPAELEVLVFDMVRSIVEHWPQPPDPIRGRSWNDLLRLECVRVRRGNRNILRSLIRKVAGSKGSALTRFQSDGAVGAVTPIPSGDRRAVVLRALGTPPLLYRAESAGRVRERRDRVHVYVDVSGSIADLKGALYGAVLDCRDAVYPAVHLFSTVVHDVSFGGLRNGECRTTDGTSIECVASHIQKHGVRRAVLLTDGWVGRPGSSAARTLAAVRLGVALTPNANRRDLERFVRHWAELEKGK